MTFNISVSPSGHNFSCGSDETILAAAIRAGVGLPYGCKNGVCASCKGKVINGAVTYPASLKKALTHEEQEQGFALFCCARPTSDVAIEVREVHGLGDLPLKKLPVRVNKIEHLSDDVIVLTLQLPGTERLQYKAGQYVEFILKDGKRRCYSIANAPDPDQPMTLHIRHMSGGLFTDRVFGNLKERDILRLEGPLGSFFLDEESDKPIVFLATGTGFAPIKAVIEQMQKHDICRPMTFYWGGRRPQDLYMDTLCQQWQASLENFTYIPIVSRALEEDRWTGRTGHVQDAAIQDFPDLSGHQVYACGSPQMVKTAHSELTKRCALPGEAFHSDIFTSEADLNAE